MKTYTSILVMVLTTISVSSFSQNLVNSQSWTVGSGSIGVFSENGNDTQNFREMGPGPMGTQTILWKAVADAANGADGGWTTSNFTIDNTKMYRFAVWIKKSNSTDGYTYFGCGTYDILDLSGSVNSNPYFWLGDLPLLDRWYLLVGYVHGSGDASTTSYGGIYDGVTGAKVVSTQDFKFSSTATTTVHRAYLYYDQTTSDRQYFYGPEVYKVDQPLTETILPSIVSGNAFFGGNVGIGTTTPNAKLDIDIGNSSALSLSLKSTNSSFHGSGALSFSSTLTTAPFYIYSWDNELQFSQRNADGSYKSHFMIFNNASGNVYFPNSTGNVGIGTQSPDAKLAVSGQVHAQEVKVSVTVPGPDYVFEKDYKLTSLEEIKNYIDQNKHLPEVPSAKEMEKNGVQLGEMNMLLLKKIEELTLYVIELKKRDEAQQQEIEILRTKNNQHEKINSCDHHYLQ